MGSWFDVEKIDDTTYMISEYGHPEKVHSYLLVDESCACLIDTGLGIGNIKEVTDSITNLPIKVITTHVHWDHIGGHGLFNEIYVHKEEADWLRNGMPRTLEQIRGFVLEEPITKPFPHGFNINNYYPYKGEPAGELKDNHIIKLDKRELRIIFTPGHSPGHICIFEEERGYLYTGDLIYKGILYAFLPESQPVVYMESVQKIGRLKSVKRILPAHNELNIEPDFIEKVISAFEEIKSNGLLEKGKGIINFEDFKIHL